VAHYAQMQDSALIKEGVMAEQFIGQHLQSILANLPSLQQLNNKIESAKKSVEVDYQLISLPLYLIERLPQLLA